MSPGQQVAEVQVKLLALALGMAAFNTEMVLGRDIGINTGDQPASQEAHSLVRTASNSTWGLDPSIEEVQRISLNPLPTRRETAGFRGSSLPESC